MSYLYDVIVLGLGAMGSATLYQLSKKDANVLGIDQFDPPHIHGSSHGDTRITRLAIGEGEEYTPLVLKSHETWRELETKIREKLLFNTGGLILGSNKAVSVPHGVANFIEETVKVAKRHSIKHEVLNASEIRKRFPQLAVKDDTVAYYEYEAGYVNPEAAVKSQLVLAEEYGAHIHRNEKILEIDFRNSPVRLRSKNNTYQCKRLVIASGPWLGQLIDKKYQQIFKVYRQVFYWLDIEKNYSNFTPDKFPIFIYLGETDTDLLYGFPAVDGPREGLKVASEQYKETTTPDGVTRGISEKEKQQIYNLAESYIHGIQRKTVRSAICMYTTTPDHKFVIDYLPENPNIIIASPCSGHGFKHSAAIGEIIAKMVAEEPLTLNMQPFCINRFS